MPQSMRRNKIEHKAKDCSNTIRVYFAPPLTSAGSKEEQNISQADLCRRISENRKLKGTEAQNVQDIIDLLLDKK